MNKNINMNVRFAENESKMIDDLVALYSKDSFIPPTKSDIIRHAVNELYKGKLLEKKTASNK
ncbi:hypothetical protein P4594_25035 [Priestia megaterium]|uniref:hypothetical protein n=1 Tax=Priestia TaxID=2800373 RepID=UPI000BF7040A|nr:hypothetical protein [Priestia megaterium]MCR8867437.1 hypothetical protein [Priestia megaterium]MED3928316.1 hypothetical protein [Priestia megaterium]MED4030665.1 hypothetical protein [Priestia megaterium]PFQ76306.1 hypothetical protein COK11_26025 [Priestia megaterium]